MRRYSVYVLNALIIGIGLAGLALLILEFGWPLTHEEESLVMKLMTALLGLFAVCALLNWGLAQDRGEYFRSHRAMLLIVGISLIALVLDRQLPGLLKGRLPDKDITRLILLYVSGTQLLVLAGVALHALPAIERHVLVRLSPGIMLILTFLFLIIAGTGLLKLPLATPPHVELGWLDALFTATSAVCVTGLIVVDTATEFTRTGQAILLLLFQVGGLGIMTLTYFLAVLAGEGLSVRNRVQLSELVNEDRLSSLGTLLMMIMVTTFTMELVGTVSLAVLWSEGGALPVHWFDALFHSVSAFCNAGFSTFTLNLADPLTAHSVPIHLLIAGLIIMGGLGFPVLMDLGKGFVRLVLRKGESVRGLNTHTRLVISTTLVLLVVGTMLGIITGMGEGDGFLRTLDVAFFNAVTARTAGFNITDIGQLLPAAALILIGLMFIGGSPGGMAGGIKTTTFALAVLNVIRLLGNRRDIEVFRRRLPVDLTEQAFATVLLGISWIFIASAMLLWFEPGMDPLSGFFEVVSAFATVGLSRGVTADLSSASKGLIILTMFVGRIGIFTFTMALLRSRKFTPVRMPSDSVILG